jgi:hypothetical protein
VTRIVNPHDRSLKVEDEDRFRRRGLARAEQIATTNFGIIFRYSVRVTQTNVCETSGSQCD